MEAPTTQAPDLIKVVQEILTKIFPPKKEKPTAK